jgi:CDP-4-dehydro-6-deoxyglucose reductase, E1
VFVIESLKGRVDALAKDIFEELHSAKKFLPGESPIPVTGKYFGVEEIASAMMASGEFWLTAGPHTENFERQIAQRVGMRHAFMVNSGSSANLIAISTLTSNKLGERRLRLGDEVLTVAAGFPTTVAPIIQNGLVPVYIDIDLGTYVAKAEMLEEAIGPKTKAIMMAHTLGNPFNLDVVMELAKKHNLWVIEDNCDALGGTYDGNNLGSFGDLSTLSFYPAHHITTGEGGAVLTRKASLKPIIESFRDWGRDCWCAPGKDNTCLKRYDWQLGQLPEGYDHKYTYSHLGYNLKSGDIQAAIGIAQLDRLESFISKRRSNFEQLSSSLLELQEMLILPSPTPKSNPSWFGFPITVKENASVTRDQIVKYLNDKKIGTRLLFGGNLLRQPAFIDTPRRIVGSLESTDFVMRNTFWIGVWPGLTEEMLNFVSNSIREVLT